MSPARPSPELLYFTERGSGPPLLLVHGLMVTGEMFELVIGQLAARHRVIVADLRGHGRTRGLPPPDTAAQLAADLSHLLGHLGAGPAAVPGYSHGGAIAQQLALDHPQLGKDRAGWLAALIADQDRALMAAAWREAMAFDSRRRLAEIACPVLVIAGPDDRAVPIHHAEMLHDGVPGSRLAVINGAGHALIWTHPSEFLGVTEEFLGA